ncbi:MAG: hypothetical protein OHK006_20120 [Thermodesulfovibrionales bacterium]
MKQCVFDSYALMAFFEDEPGAEHVQRLLQQAELDKISISMSIVNWGEVYYALARSKGSDKADEALLLIEQLPVRLVDVDRGSMLQVALLKAKYPVALGHCFAAALGIARKCPVVTGDREFEKIKDLTAIEWLR